MSLPSLQVCRLEPWLPALTALHLCGNDMSALDGPALPEGAFSRLQVWDLCLRMNKQNLGYKCTHGYVLVGSVGIKRAFNFAPTFQSILTTPIERTTASGSVAGH